MRVLRAAASFLALTAIPVQCQSAPARPVIIYGELQQITEDITPPTRLDLYMYHKKIDGLTPLERCNNYGGTLKSGSLRCKDVDY